MTSPQSSRVVLLPPGIPLSLPTYRIVVVVLQAGCQFPSIGWGRRCQVPGMGASASFPSQQPFSQWERCEGTGLQGAAGFALQPGAELCCEACEEKTEDRQKRMDNTTPPHPAGWPGWWPRAAVVQTLTVWIMESVDLSSGWRRGLLAIHPTWVGWGWLDGICGPQNPEPQKERQGGRLDNGEIRAAGFMRCASPGGSPFGESPARRWFAGAEVLLLMRCCRPLRCRLSVVVAACSLVWG